jgi:hypothetical protein
MKAKYCGWVATLLATVTVLPAAFAPGGDAYTKRVETALLAEPNMVAATVARLGYAKKVRVDAVKGAWLRVSESKNTGWVFAGNLAEEQPSETRGLDGLPIAASDTSAASAARPLVPAAQDYSSRRGLTKPAEDLNWLTQQAAAITPADVKTFLVEKKKGEYQ